MIEHVIEPRRRDIGGGFEVGRVLPHASRRMVGPFIFFDHFGPAQFEAGVSKSLDVRPHPHIGLATLTYLFDGEIVHRDSLAIEQAIRPGEVNWMIAGKGVTHSERFEKARREGDNLHGLQSWIALPLEHEESDPGFFHYSSDEELPHYQSGGLGARLIAGEAFGTKAAVKTLSPMFYVHWTLAAGTRAGLPAEYPERAAYVVSGEVEVDGRSYDGGKMLVFQPGETITFDAKQDSVVMLLGGEPIGERFIEWNFVASSKERIEQAKADWRAGRMKLPDLDHDEFIPLPE
jgi:redox-sensitive bicupin YhaK (pirin superfamily)